MTGIQMVTLIKMIQAKGNCDPIWCDWNICPIRQACVDKRFTRNHQVFSEAIQSYRRLYKDKSIEEIKEDLVEYLI